MLSLHVKCPKACGLVQGNCLLPKKKKDIPVNYQAIGYESHLHSLETLEGYPVVTSHPT